MRFTQVVSVAFRLLGGLLCFFALIAAGFSANALVERLQHGRGLMFADVEFLALAAVVLLVPGLLLLFVASRLSRRVRDGESQGAA
jgi:hypothetical protein